MKDKLKHIIDLTVKYNLVSKVKNKLEYMYRFSDKKSREKRNKYMREYRKRHAKQ